MIQLIHKIIIKIPYIYISSIYNFHGFYGSIHPRWSQKSPGRSPAPHSCGPARNPRILPARPGGSGSTWSPRTLGVWASRFWPKNAWFWWVVDGFWLAFHGFWMGFFGWFLWKPPFLLGAIASCRGLCLRRYGTHVGFCETLHLECRNVRSLGTYWYIFIDGNRYITSKYLSFHAGGT